MFGWLRPQDSLTDAQVDRGLRSMLYAGVAAQTMVSLTGGAFLVAFALLLGASNTTIGLLAAIGPISQVAQIPAIFLIDRTRARKAILIISATIARLMWLAVAALPLVMAPEAARPALLGLLLALSAIGAVAGCAFNSWVRDLVPEDRMGKYFARRMAVSIAVGAAMSLAAGLAVDLFTRYSEDALPIYSVLFAIGAVVGLSGLMFYSRTPEPRMPKAPSESLWAVLAAPLRDRNYRNVLAFLGSWTFALTFAGPFFTVYMLRRLGLSMTWVLALSVASQLVHVLFLKLWGALADRFSNKSVLAVSCPLLLLSFIIWPFTTMPDPYVLTLPLLLAIHALSGMATAGVNLGAGNLALKAAPRGRATAYLATNALLCGLAGTLAPILGGLAADFFDPQQLGLNLLWSSTATDPASEFRLPAMSLRGLDFLFILAFLMGLYAVHRLLPVKEEGEVAEKVVRGEFYGQLRRAMRNVSTVGGMRDLLVFPVIKVRDAMRGNGSNRQFGKTGDPPPGGAAPLPDAEQEEP